jgi:antitoxin YefM
LYFFLQEDRVATEVTYTQARAHFASLLKQVTGDREIVIIQRRGGEDAALISAAELRGLLETAHLLRSPKNAERLATALEHAQRGEGSTLTLDELRRRANVG